MLPRFSPDNRWLAYSSNETGTYQIYVVPFPSGGPKRQISNDGGIDPHWRKDGKELFYLSLDGKLMAVDINAGNEMDSGTPHLLFDTKLSVKTDTRRQYAASADGRRFLLQKPLAEAASIPFNIILNWTSLLKK